MLRIDKQFEPITGVVVYGDDDPSTFYIVPQQPTFRLDDQGKPVFKFFKYNQPVPRKDGKLAGGLLVFDVEFFVPEQTRARVIEALKAQVPASSSGGRITIGSLTYLRGTTTLTVLDSSSGGRFVEKVVNPTKPSLFGRNITSFSVELTLEGATTCEQALQGGGGVVQVTYDLYFNVKLPPLKAHIWFKAEKFSSFYQTIDKESKTLFFWGEDKITEVLRERFVSSGSGDVVLDFGDMALPDPEQDKKLKGEIRDWAWRTLAEHVKRAILTDPTAPERGLPDGQDHSMRNIVIDKNSSFDSTYKENQAIEWHLAPNGILPNITEFLDAQGNRLPIGDYFKTVTLDDPFFRDLRVTVQVNADFDTLPIHAVEVTLNYRGRPFWAVGNDGAALSTAATGTAFLRGPNDVAKFSINPDPDDREYTYTYSYVVHYKNTDGQLSSTKLQRQGDLQIDVGDLGMLAIDIAPGDLNFAEVREAHVSIQYEDKSAGVAPVDFTSILTTAHRTDRFVKHIGQPRRGAYRYRVKYYMADGKEYQAGWSESRASQLYIDDPFSGTRTIAVRGIGNFETDIDTIFLDLAYVDRANGYTQSKSIALTKILAFIDWSFPVIDDRSGELTYSGTIKNKNGTQEDIPSTLASGNTVLVGKQIEDFMDVEVIADAVDWNAVSFITLQVQCPGAAGQKDASRVIRKGVEIPKLHFDLKDKTQKSITWSATFFLTDHSKRSTPPTTSSDLFLVLELPTA